MNEEKEKETHKPNKYLKWKQNKTKKREKIPNQNIQAHRDDTIAFEHTNKRTQMVGFCCCCSYVQTTTNTTAYLAKKK